MSISIKYTLLDLNGNIDQITSLKKFLQVDNISIYTDVDKYNDDKKLSKYTDDFTTLYFKNYINEFEVLLLISDKSKKELRKIKSSIQGFAFYPLQIFSIKQNTTTAELSPKLNPKTLYDIGKLKNIFYSKYNQLVEESKNYTNEKPRIDSVHLDFLIKNIKE